MKEIGGDFCKVHVGKGIGTLWREWMNYGEKRFLVSGRDALHYILDDIYQTKKLTKVYMPSYSCYSIIEPFVARGIHIDFYSVTYYDDGLFQDIKDDHECDVILIMEYFGYRDPAVNEHASRFAERGKIVIQDMTHSLFAEKPIISCAQYVFASIRKWFAIYGASIVIKQKGGFILPQPKSDYIEYLHLRMRAMHNKSLYLYAAKEDVEDYLSLYKQAEVLLDYQDIHYAPDDISLSSLMSINFSAAKKRRQDNASIIIQYFPENDWIKPLYSSKFKAQCPLCLPVLVRKDLRNSFQEYLIKNRVYCPVHWPISNKHHLHEQNLDIYLRELSLVCDQRYIEKDMIRIIELINKFPK